MVTLNIGEAEGLGLGNSLMSYLLNEQKTDGDHYDMYSKKFVNQK